MFNTNVKIIIVDDCKVILDVTKSVLEGLGYTIVKTFLSPTSALEYFQKNHNNIDIVLTDLNMPDISGVEMILEMNKVATKKVRGILVTGETAFISEAIPVLQKPYNLEDLEKAIEEILKE